MAQVRTVAVSNAGAGQGVVLLDNGGSMEDASFLVTTVNPGDAVSFELLGQNDDDSRQTLGSGMPLTQNDLPLSLDLAAGEQVFAAANPTVNLRVLRVRRQS